MFCLWLANSCPTTGRTPTVNGQAILCMDFLYDSRRSRHLSVIRTQMAYRLRPGLRGIKLEMEIIRYEFIFLMKKDKKLTICRTGKVVFQK